jgi:two-component system, NarL family, response regulator NreC
MGVVTRNPDAINLLLASDEPLTRAGWRAVVEAIEGVSVVGEPDCGTEVERAITAAPIDVVVLDVRLDEGAGVEAIQRIRRRSPQTAVVVATSSDHPDSARRSLEAGAVAYLSKTDTPEDLVGAIQTAAEGGEYRQASLANLLKRDPKPTANGEISDRERDVLRLLALGHTNREIARKLYLSVRTVETHRASLLRKLGASSRADLVGYALRNRLVGTGT